MSDQPSDQRPICLGDQSPISGETAVCGSFDDFSILDDWEWQPVITSQSSKIPTLGLISVVYF